MNGKDYSEGNLSKMIDAAHQHIDDKGIKDSILAKCYQVLGLIVAGAPVDQRAHITLTDQEAETMRKAIHRWHRDKKQSRDKFL